MQNRTVFKALLRAPGDWTALPGGEIDRGGGTLALRIESNDRLVITDSRPINGVPYGAAVLTRRAGGTIETGPQPREPWDTPQGQAAIEAWIVEVTKMMNDYKGSDEYNRRKPYSFNQYGLVEGGGIRSANPPDNFKEFYRNSKYCFMWSFYTAGPDTWEDRTWRTLRVPGLRDYVNARVSASR